MIVLDATGLVLGRLASVTAKSLLAGEEIKIVNAEKAIITGSKDYIFSDYGQARARGHKERGPYFPRRPEMILKRTVRGMLPYKLQRGRDAMSRLRVYVGVPRELKGLQFDQPAAAKMRLASNNKYHPGRLRLPDLPRSGRADGQGAVDPQTHWWPWMLPTKTLEMGWCINCHRENGGPQDCYACHY